ncbi:MAG: hypothetical protein GDA49_01970 [Rhodospirillales bacterium]|nr:hypothetical protein [Rhodospirillales bacterium]
MVTDFSLAENDVIDLSGLSDIDGFNDLMADHLSTDGTSVVISDDGGDSIIVIANQTHFIEEDFLF